MASERRTRVLLAVVALVVFVAALSAAVWVLRQPALTPVPLPSVSLG